MQLKFLPSFDDVRAVLGVSDDELSDETLGLFVYQHALEEAYDSLSEEVIPLYDSIVEKIEAKQLVTRNERKAKGLMEVYGIYVVADKAASALPMFAAQSITDGKAEGRRFDEAYAQVLKDLRAEKATYMEKLKEVLVTLGITIEEEAPYVFPFGRATLDIDPVTNEAQ